MFSFKTLLMRKMRLQLQSMNYCSRHHMRAAGLCLVVVTVLSFLLLSGPTLPQSRLLLLHLPPPHSDSSWDDEVTVKCSPIKHVFFLKTHKCASSTVQNVLLRYGYQHNLTFALPAIGNYLGSPELFQREMLSGPLFPASGKVDLFVVHTRLHPLEHSSILHPDTSWVTIVRDPAALYESLFNFYHMYKPYGIHLEQFNHKTMKELSSIPRYGGKFGKNQMLFDLGYPDNLSVEELRRAIDDLDQRFHLVMIAELMEESLILLRHLLCWTLYDVVVFTKNARRQEVKPQLDHYTVQTLRDLNSADVLLYEHFLARHHEAVHKFGEQRMAEEVTALSRLREEYYKHCGAKKVKGRDAGLKFKEYSGMVSGYITDNNTGANCQLLSMPELPLLDTIRKHQLMLLEGQL